MIEIRYEKREKLYWVAGKTKPCSSKSKMMVYITRIFCKQLPDKGKITIEGVNDEIANTR